MPELTHSMITTSRGRFGVRDSGNSGGGPLVMIHGWPESSCCWVPVSRHLPDRLRVIAPDLRGLGDSERTPGLEHYLKQALARDVIAQLDEMGVRDFYLAGHDWGGVVAQEVALEVPERVRRLVIMNIVLINNLQGNMETIEHVRRGSGFAYWYQHFQQTGLPEELIPGNEAAWLGYFLRDAEGRPLPQDAIDEYVRCYSIDGTPGTGANYYRTFAEDAKRWATLAGHRYPMPSLLVWGMRDPVVLPEYLNHHEDCFDDVRVVRLQAGHFLQEEQPEAVAHALDEFLP